MDRQECLRLLAARPVGRLAYCGASGPVIVPLNHVVVGDGLLFRTDARSNAAREIPNRRVAFEVDDLDDFLRAGWSVQVQAFAELLPAETLRMLDLPQMPEPWAAGDRSVFVRLPLTEVTGRRVHPS